MRFLQEQFRKTTRFLTWAKEQLAITGAAVMGCLEEKLREALRQDARRCLEELLNDPAGQAGTREIKVGVVFTQASPENPPAEVKAKTNGKKKSEEESRPERNPGSTRYLTTSGNAQEFGQQLRHLARQQAMGLATLVVFLGDGAAWVWELARCVLENDDFDRFWDQRSTAPKAFAKAA